MVGHLMEREPYWDYMGRRLREDKSNMTDLINPSEYSENEITVTQIVSLSDKIQATRKQLLDLENVLKEYINQTITTDKPEQNEHEYYYAHGKHWKFVNGQYVIDEKQLEFDL